MAKKYVSIPKTTKQAKAWGWVGADNSISESLATGIIWKSVGNDWAIIHSINRVNAIYDIYYFQKGTFRKEFSNVTNDPTFWDKFPEVSEENEMQFVSDLFWEFGPENMFGISHSVFSIKWND